MQMSTNCSPTTKWEKLLHDNVTSFAAAIKAFCVYGNGSDPVDFHEENNLILSMQDFIRISYLCVNAPVGSDIVAVDKTN